MILFVTLVEHIGYQKLHKALSQYLREIYNVSNTQQGFNMFLRYMSHLTMSFIFSLWSAA